VRAITLFKNEQRDLFIKSQNNLEFLMQSNWHTNGKYLVIRKKDKAWFFDINTGIKVHKQATHKNEIVMIHNYVQDTMFVFHDNKVQEGSLKNFKTYVNKDSGDQCKTSAEVYTKFKDRYLGKAEPAKSLSVIQRLMRKGPQKPAEQPASELPENAVSLIQVVLLSFINEKSQEFDRELKENANKRDKEGFYMKCFKYPFSTYLTAELFEGLQTLISHYSEALVKQRKTEATITDQYSFLYLINILSLNIQGLTYTGITLLDLLDIEGYQRFLKFYNDNIVSMIDIGYTADFEEGVESELKGIWEGIYETCQHIITQAMNLIYDDTKEILKTLAAKLDSQMTAKEAENMSFSLRFLSKPESCKKMLAFENIDQFDVLQKVFEHCSNICRKSKQTYLSSFDFLSEKFVSPNLTLLEEAANRFIQQFSENFLLLYCDADQKAQVSRKSKKVGMSWFA